MGAEAHLLKNRETEEEQSEMEFWGCCTWGLKPPPPKEIRKIEQTFEDD
jgi:hypothetical protein